MKKWLLLVAVFFLSCSDYDYVPANAFIVNKDGSTILKCPYNANTVDFSLCKSLGVSGLTNPVSLVFNTFSTLNLFDVYISNYGGTADSNQILQCNYAGGAITGCTKASFQGYDFPVNLTIYGTYLYVPSYANNQLLTYFPAGAGTIASAAIPSPTAIYFVSVNNVLVTSQSSSDQNKILSCTANTGSIGNCTTALDLGTEVPLSIGQYNGYYYFTIPSTNRVRKCSYANNVLSSCSDVGDNTLYNYPYGITFQDGLVYIPNREPGVNSIVVCNVSSTDGTFSGCALQTAGGQLNGPIWVVFL